MELVTVVKVECLFRLIGKGACARYRVEKWKDSGKKGKKTVTQYGSKPQQGQGN